ncbi:MAG: hypothetical protein WCH61_04835 [bacterium]
MAKAKSKNQVPAATAKVAASAQPTPNPVKPATAPDLMSQCVLFCQHQRWREASQLMRRLQDRALADGNPELAANLGGAGAKIEFSLRRQMAAAAIRKTQELLAKEFLLDVVES